MKTKLTILPPSPATTTQNRESLDAVRHSTAPTSPSGVVNLKSAAGRCRSSVLPADQTLPAETLLNLGAIVINQQMAATLGDDAEKLISGPIIAGIIVTLAEILPPHQFKQVMVQWEIDQIKLAECFELCGFDAGDTQIQSLINL